MKIIELQQLYNKYKKWFTRKEENEQIQFVMWLEINWYKYFAVPNSTWTKSITQQVRNTLMWVVSWPPDICIILKRWSILFLELKRSLEATDYGKKWQLLASSPSASSEQQEWIDILNGIDNVRATVAIGLKEAIRIVEESENL
jgi:hypothetical protein